MGYKKDQESEICFNFNEELLNDLELGMTQILEFHDTKNQFYKSKDKFMTIL